MSGKIRIIGGQWRGRKLPVLNKAGLRPTTDRVKETVFNWLMPIIEGSRCLDAFAGAGSLGFEAASRGATEVTLLEKDKQVAQHLKQQCQTLKATQITPICTDTLRFLSKPASQTFSLVFLDPPFHKNLLSDCIQQLENQQWLTENAFIYIEVEKKLPLELPENWHIHREKIMGQVRSILVQRH